MSLQHIPKTCDFDRDFVPATRPRYTSLIQVVSVCAATCRFGMSQQHDVVCVV